MIGPGATLSDEEVAVRAGTTVAAVAAFNNSVPYWELKRKFRQVARVLGVDEAHLAAAISKAERASWGDRGHGGGSDQAVLSGMRVAE